MAVKIQYPESPSLMFGVHDPKPLVMFPAGRARICMRENAYVKIYIKTSTGIRCFYPRSLGNVWICDYRLEKGRNETV